MTDPGLNQRLKQRSRRSGLMIGFSMVLTLMVCVAAFTIIYARLEPAMSDFVGRGDIELPTAIPTEEPVAQEAPPPATKSPAEVEKTPSTEGGDNQASEKTAEPDANDKEFKPDFQISADGPVNLRPGPGVASGNAILALPVGTPLMYLEEETPTTDPERDDLGEGDVWMKFQTEEGEEGWVREVDVSTYVP